MTKRKTKPAPEIFWAEPPEGIRNLCTHCLACWTRSYADQPPVFVCMLDMQPIPEDIASCNFERKAAR